MYARTYTLVQACQPAPRAYLRGEDTRRASLKGVHSRCLKWYFFFLSLSSFFRFSSCFFFLSSSSTSRLTPVVFFSRREDRCRRLCRRILICEIRMKEFPWRTRATTRPFPRRRLCETAENDARLSLVYDGNTLQTRLKAPAGVKKSEERREPDE